MPRTGSPKESRGRVAGLLSGRNGRKCIQGLLAAALLSPTIDAQVLRSEADDPNAPTYRELSPQITPQLNETIREMQSLLRELRSQKLTPEQQRAALEQLIRDREFILRQHNTWLDWQKPQTVESAALLLERMLFEEAAQLAPTPEARERVLENAPEHLGLDPGKPDTAETYEPPLLAPVKATGKKAKDLPSQDVVDTPQRQTPAPDAGVPLPGSSPADGPAASDAESVGPAAAIHAKVLADSTATTDMHEDNAVLRKVTDSDGQLVLFGALHLWAGGAIQFDSYRGDGLFTLDEDGDSDSKTVTRRGEGILRVSVLDNSEVQIQYDFESSIFKNVYWRWLSRSDSQSLTIGNQKEPMGLDYLVGGKFATAMEPSAPTSTFASYRSKGIRYSGWTTLSSGENPMRWWGDSSTYVTGSIGVFGEDLEDSNDTDWAVTGRFTMGGLTSAATGFHLGASASYRHGEYDSIAPRPELDDVGRIPLANPRADTLALLGLEAMGVMGSLHGQLELYYADYSGDVDATGWGGYAQVGWLFGGKRRQYRPKWGTWSHIDAVKEQVFEVFARASLTSGNDDINPSNELGLLTLGGNWYYRQFRVGANLLYADTDRRVFRQDDGYAIALRLQYLF